jgi:molecular chaperone Hsp33
MTDYLVRAINEKATVIGLACVTTGLVNEASRLHGASRTVSAALGRALTGALMMGALMKRGQRVALKFEGNGPLKRIIVEADHEGTARGFVSVPEVEVPLLDEKLNVAGALGREGLLTVIKDVGMKEPYRGIVKLFTGEIAEDIAHYLVESEQIPSAVGLGVFVTNDGKVAAAGGFLVQSLPPSEVRMVDRLVENIRKIPSITDLLRQGRTPEDILAMIFEGISHHVLGRKNLSFRCTCSRERIQRVLISLGRDELQKLMIEQEAAEVTCEFCRARYHFTREELGNLLREMHSPG